MKTCILHTAFEYNIVVIHPADERKGHGNNLQPSSYDMIITLSLGVENLPKEPLNQIENGSEFLNISYEKVEQKKDF